jgi:hypothetical protein
MSSSSSSSIVRSAIERAESRASVLNSLEKSYGKANQQKVLKKSPVIDRNSSLTGLRTFQSIQGFIGDQREKARKTLSDALLGKSIVLSNTRAQSDAAKNAKKVKR